MLNLLLYLVIEEVFCRGNNENIASDNKDYGLALNTYLANITLDYN